MVQSEVQECEVSANGRGKAPINIKISVDILGYENQLPTCSVPGILSLRITGMRNR